MVFSMRLSRLWPSNPLFDRRFRAAPSSKGLHLGPKNPVLRIPPFLMRRASGLAIAVLLSFTAHAAMPTPGSFITSVFGSNSGLPQPIEDVVQTNDGYLWLATQAGVARFDGMRFTLYRAADYPGLPCNAIQALLDDGGGSLWVGTDRGLARFHRDRFETVGSTTLSVMSLAIDHGGTVWVGTKQGLWQVRDGTLVAIEPPILKGQSIRELFVDRSGRVWIAPFRAALAYFEKGEFHLFENHGTHLNGVEVMAEARDGTFWISTVDNGVYRLHGDELRNYGPEQGLGSRIAAAVYVDRQDRVWAVADGVYMLGRGGPDRFGLVLPRTFENFRAITEDREGNIWLGTHANGLFRVSPTPLRVFSEATGFSGSVRTVTEDHEGKLWVSVTQQPLVSIQPGGAVERHSAADGYEEDSFSVYVTSDGSLWSGGRRKLQLIRQGHIENFPKYPSARAVFEDHRGTIWIAPESGPVVCYRNGQFETIGGAHGVPAANADCFAEAADGTLYIGLYRSGVVAVKDGSAKVYDTSNGLPANDVRAVYVDSQGNLWVGTKGRGLALFADGVWWNPQPFADLFQDQVSAIAEDGHGNLFIGSLKGVFYARTTDLLRMAHGGTAAQLHAVVLGDGVLSDAVYSSTQPVVWKAHDGVMWFATRQGLFGIDPSQLGTDRTPPPVYIEGVTADHRPQPIGRELELAPGTRSLTIDYTAIGLTRPQEVLFRYKLDGYDEAWADVGTRRTAYYSNLAPGSYVFRVMACNDDGVWNETGASLAITLQPYFYQTRWFLLTMVGALGAVIYGGYEWRVLRLKTRERELNRRVDEALGKVKVLSGLLPICASCKKVRDDKGYWNQIEVFIRDRSEADFSHGICPECAKQLFPSVCDHVKPPVPRVERVDK
jgi:ligand-binding sensor domain-containing protein